MISYEEKVHSSADVVHDFSHTRVYDMEIPVEMWDVFRILKRNFGKRQISAIFSLIQYKVIFLPSVQVFNSKNEMRIYVEYLH